MITAPTNWTALEAATDSKMEIKIEMDGQTFENQDLAAGDVKITHALYDSFGIGNAAAGELTATLLDVTSISDGILRVDPYVRWVSGDGQTVTDWVQQGVFWLDSVKINQDKGATITAYDSLMLAEQAFNPGPEDQWTNPPASDVVNYICGVLWTTLDSRSSIPSVSIAYPGNKTIREVLQEIAVAGHGNWTMTKAGKLRLVPIAGNTSSSRQSISVTDLESTSNRQRVTQVILKDGSTSYASGADGGFTLEGSFAGADQTMADSLLSATRNIYYQGYNISGGLYSALLELGDPVSTTIDGTTYYYMFDSYSCLYEEGCWGEIESPVDTDVSHRIRFSNAQGTKSDAEKAAEQYGLKVVSVAALPSVQDSNTLYLVQGSPN